MSLCVIHLCAFDLLLLVSISKQLLTASLPGSDTKSLLPPRVSIPAITLVQV